jgi:uncharacterized protein DUF4124
LIRRAAALAYLMSLTATAGDVYRSVDAQGHVQYSDTPTPGAELVHTQVPRSASAPPSANLGTAPATPKPLDAKTGTASPTNPATADAQRALHNDVEQVRADQCQKAQDSYQQAIQARRVYRPGADGEREYLSDEEADQVRLNARLEMEAACKGS